MAKVLGSSATVPVYNIKSLNQVATPSFRTFFPNIWCGIKKSISINLSQEQMSTIMQYVYGLKESLNVVNDSNKGVRVPPQYTVMIDKSTVWYDEKAKVE